MKESYSAVLARLDERVKNLSENNSTEHKEIVGLISDLKKHVNDENEKMDLRMKACEGSLLKEKITWEVLAKIGATTLTIISISAGLIKLILLGV